MRVKDKVAIVTGASVGIGRAAAELLAEEGATVYAISKNEPEPFASKAVHWHSLDVASLEGWQALGERVLKEQGKIDILVNNAGIMGSYDPVHSIDLAVWDRTIAVNLSGTFYGMRTVIPAMQKAGGGSIVNISSIWGDVGVGGVAAYQASKGGILTLTRNAAISYAGDKIRVNAINPGIVWTPMIAAQDASINDWVVSMTPLKRMGEPREIAYGILFLASDEASYVTGADLAIDGGYMAQ